MRCASPVPLVIGFLVVFCAPARAEQAFLADVIGGMTIRTGVGGEVELDSPGGGVRLDFGRHLGYGFWLLGTVSWAHVGGKKAEDCAGCVYAESADTLMAGFTIRYTLPLPGVEMFIQMGPGFLVDILDRSGGESGDPPAGFNQQAAFSGSLGLGFEVAGDFTVGVRADTLLGSQLDSLSLGAYAGYRFEFAERPHRSSR